MIQHTCCAAVLSTHAREVAVGICVQHAISISVIVANANVELAAVRCIKGEQGQSASVYPSGKPSHGYILRQVLAQLLQADC